MSHWRTEPQYRGFVSDGYYETPDGRLHFRAVDPAEVRGRLAAVLGELAELPIVRAVAIDGQSPTAEQVAAVRRELSKAPPAVLADFRVHHGQVEVTPHGRANDHPVARLCRHTGRAFGFIAQAPGYSPLIVVEAAADCGTELHELAHFVDRGNRFSGLPEWQRMAAAATEIICFRGSLADSDGGPLAGLFNARRNPAEAFCEAFAVCFYSPRTRRHLSGDMQRFIERASST